MKIDAWAHMDPPLLFLSINLLSVCSDLLQYICFLNLTTPVEVMAKVYVILDHSSFVRKSFRQNDFFTILHYKAIIYTDNV